MPLDDMNKLFAHRDVLRSQERETVEPQTNRRGQEIFIDNTITITSTITTSSSSDEEEEMDDQAYLHCPQARQMVQKRDFISLLKLGWNKQYGEDPSFNTKFDPRDGIRNLEEELMAGPWGTITGSGRTRKLAQHQAASKLLFAIVESGRHKEFCIPGHDANEAQQILNTMVTQEGQNSTVSNVPPSTVPALGDNNSKICAASTCLSSNSNASQTPLASSTTAAAIQINWVGKVQELVMKRRIMSEWKDVYTQTGQANSAEHTCELKFDILDAVTKNPTRRLEGTGFARNKKQAKQLAFKQIYDQINEHYGLRHFSSSQVAKSSNATNMQKTGTTPAAGQDQSTEMALNSADNDPYALTLQSDNEMIDTDENGVITERPNIHLLLSQTLSDRQQKIDGAENFLRRILQYKDPQVERLFKQAQLKFIDTKSYDGVAQIYLEVWVLGISVNSNSNSAKSKKPSAPQPMLLCTFGGQGANKEQARDDACWQVMEFLYIFGGFAPSTEAADDQDDDGNNKQAESQPIVSAVECDESSKQREI